MRVDSDEFIKLADAVDVLDGAAQNMLTAQPFQMTDAAHRLDRARLAMRAAMNAAMVAAARSEAGK